MSFARTEIISDRLSEFSQYKYDYEWLTGKGCITHGYSCPCSDTITQRLQTAHVILEKDDVENFVNYHFDTTDSFKRKLISATFAVFVKSEDKYTHFEYSPGGSIEVTLVQVIGYRSPTGLLEVIMGVIRYKRQTCHDHHYVESYFNSDASRAEKALQYLFYKDVNPKIKRIEL
ncbi:102_t:CDS:1 [Acaulospora colombiana]|uniref:102_t:CDS:1 n=1 Tax=Acaulospora colombiana TaxID=27376 RepID=A0ACA9LXZ7_9GLOM|nr:102_t:CDS:1 [Acaulospora colombiana]